MKKPQYQPGRRHTHENNLSTGAIGSNDNRQSGKVADVHEHGEPLTKSAGKSAHAYKPKSC